jgi:hypothetical protein
MYYGMEGNMFFYDCTEYAVWLGLQQWVSMFEITASENMLPWNTSVPWAGSQYQIDLSPLSTIIY